MTSRSRRQTRRLRIGHPEVLDPVKHNRAIAVRLAERRFVDAVVAQRDVGRGFATYLVQRALELQALRLRP